MTPDWDPELIWRALPVELKLQLHTLAADLLTDDLLTRCLAAAVDNDIPVFWRPDPVSGYTAHRLHPALITHIARQPRPKRP